VQVITRADATASFDTVALPASGGASIKAVRYFNLDGSIIGAGLLPTWFREARLFLTTSRTAGTSNPGSSATDADTPCAYFDLAAGDNNPGGSGYYTIDGYNADASQTSTDVDQCAGAAASEVAQLGMFLSVDRLFMNPTDKLQIILKAKPIDAPNTAPTPASCTVAGFFEPSACTNQLFTVTMRPAPAAPAKPFYLLFPSAKSLDLLSESVLVPLHVNPSITTISIDRVKGGAIFYGFTVIRLP
jgi:hypothetical protein